MRIMNKVLAPLALAALLSLPGGPLPGTAQAQDGTPEAPQTEDPGLIGEGLRLLFEGLLKEMEPALDEMGRAMKDLEPMARELAALLGDVRNYDPPERLPNGDIIIRRKPGAPPPPPPPGQSEPEPPQIDL
jgi:hypothetical protein